MPELLTVVDEPTVKAILDQELTGLVPQSIVFHHAYEDHCVVEVNHRFLAVDTHHLQVIGRKPPLAFAFRFSPAEQESFCVPQGLRDFKPVERP